MGGLSPTVSPFAVIMGRYEELFNKKKKHLDARMDAFQGVYTVWETIEFIVKKSRDRHRVELRYERGELSQQEYDAYQEFHGAAEAFMDSIISSVPHRGAADGGQVKSISVRSTWTEKLAFARALLREPEPTMEMDAFIKQHMRKTVSELATITVEDEVLYKASHKTDSTNDVVDPSHQAKEYTRWSVHGPRYLPKSPLRYDEFLAIRAEFSPYQFVPSDSYARTFLFAHASIWMVGKLLRLARKL